MHENRRRQRNETAREETVESADDDGRREAFDSDQAKSQDAGDAGAGDDHVHGPRAVGDEIGDDAAEDGAGVEDRKEVKADVLARDPGLDGERLDVEEDDV